MTFEPIDERTLIDQMMPTYRLRQVERIRLKSSPDKAWPVVRGLDTFELPVSRFLFSLRTLPDWINNFFGGKRNSTQRTSRIEDFTGPDKGFKILAEVPGHEIVIGSIGKFWKLKIPYQSFEPNQFTHFDQPEFGKLAWNLRLDPDAFGGSWLTWELRVTATDDDAWTAFQMYWRLIGPFSHQLRKMALKHFAEVLGSVDEETLKLPGDGKIIHPLYQRTMSTTIESKPHNIWPWLKQMGCQRAGWYSIDRLDNAGIKSAEKIIPELQNIQVGDVLPWRPKGSEGFTVHGIDEERSLILGSSAIDANIEALPIADTWVFFLEPIGPQATRLMTRVRATYQPSLKMKFMGPLFEAAHIIMEKSQLKNLKLRAEQATT